MDIEVQEQKFHQSLDQLIHSTTQLTNTLVSNVVESIPSSGEVATKLEQIDASQENSRININRRGICHVSS